MIIIHKIDALLEELFPGISTDELNQKLIEEKIKSYFTSESTEPRITIEGEYIKIEIGTESTTEQEKYFNNAVSYCEQNNYSKAKPILRDLIQQNPSNSEYHRILGQIHFDEQDFEKAMNFLIDALRWNPKNTSALIMMGNTLVKHNKDIDIVENVMPDGSRTGDLDRLIEQTKKNIQDHEVILSEESKVSSYATIEYINSNVRHVYSVIASNDIIKISNA